MKIYAFCTLSRKSLDRDIFMRRDIEHLCPRQDKMSTTITGYNKTPFFRTGKHSGNEGRCSQRITTPGCRTRAGNYPRHNGGGTKAGTRGGSSCSRSRRVVLVHLRKLHRDANRCRAHMLPSRRTELLVSPPGM